MKKIFFTAAVLAAVCIGFIGCANAAGGGADNPPPAVNHPLTTRTYNVNATLSYVADPDGFLWEIAHNPFLEKLR